MLKQKKTIIVIALAAVILLLAAAVFVLLRGDAIDEDKNLIANGGFESGIGTMPEGWGAGRWIWDDGVSYLSISQDAYSGAASVCVENAEENDARFE